MKDEEKCGILYTMEYHSVITKKEIFVTTWVDLEGIMLRDISQRKTNTIWPYLYVDSKKEKKTKTNLKDKENRLVITRAWG